VSLLPDSNVTLSNDELKNATTPIDSRLAGKATLVKTAVSRNAASPIEVSLLPDSNVTLFNKFAFRKALAPIDVTSGGIVRSPTQDVPSDTTLSVIVIEPLVQVTVELKTALRLRDVELPPHDANTKLLAVSTTAIERRDTRLDKKFIR
jgi:hypothetical protein